MAAAVTTTVLSAATALVVTSNVADVALRGTVTEAGTPADTESDVNETVNPPSGAGPVNVTVPVAVPPPITLDGETATAETPLRVIENEPDLLDPFAVAVTDTTASDVTAVVDTAKVAAVCPAGTTTIDGADAAELFQDNATDTPPDGAALVSVTVPVVCVPPMTVVGLNVTDVGEIALMFKPFETVVPDATALIVAVVSAVTPEVVTVNVPDV